MGRDNTEDVRESLRQEDAKRGVEHFTDRKGEESGKDRGTTRTARRYPDVRDDAPAMLREAGAALDYYEDPYGLGKRQGEYTVSDFYALPDDMHVELIDGWLYAMASPSFKHESIALHIYKAFDDYIEKKDGNCIAMKASMDTQVDRSDKTILQPDVFILCDQDKRRRSSIYGAPDLIVEVLSPSTAIKDRTVKLKKYRESGVREYWIVDPEEKEVLVYRFADIKFDVSPERFTFQEMVPVGIFGGECMVDFAEIEKYLVRHQLY